MNTVGNIFGSTSCAEIGGCLEIYFLTCLRYAVQTISLLFQKSDRSLVDSDLRKQVLMSIAPERGVVSHFDQLADRVFTVSGYRSRGTFGCCNKLIIYDQYPVIMTFDKAFADS